MGNRPSSQMTNHALARTVPIEQQWLINITFDIEGEKYTLLNRRGGGSFGSVWEARTSRRHHTAVKVFSIQHSLDNSERIKLADSFKTEVKMLYQMRGDRHVASIYGFTFDPHSTVGLIAMELGDDSLEQRAQYLHSNSAGSGTRDRDYVPARERKNIWMQFVDILLALKQHNIIHSDIKPGNLMFFGPALKVVDLGIAQKIRAGRYPQAIGGTAGFSAPECSIQGSTVTTKADIWSAGAILYYLTYGRSPLVQTGHLPSMPGRNQSPLVHDIIQKCLQYNPNRRPSHQEIARHPYTSTPTLV